MLNWSKHHKAKLFFEPDSFISATVLVSRKVTKNAKGPKTGKKKLLLSNFLRGIDKNLRKPRSCDFRI